jgi:hypothetical protein
VLVAVALVAPSHAGWVMKESDGTEMFVAKQKMASTWEGGGMVMNAKDKTMVLWDSNKQVYVKSTVAEFCTGTKDMFDQMMAKMPPEQAEMMKQMMGSQPDANVTVEQKGTGEKVAGYATNKYDVMNNGELYEEMWIATDKELMKDFEPFVEMMTEFVGCSSSIASFGKKVPESTEQYIKLYTSGVVLKLVNHGRAAAQKSTDVTELTKEDVPDSKFETPKGYRQVDFGELMGMQ